MRILFESESHSLEPRSIMLVIHCEVALLVVHPMSAICERIIQAVIGRDPVFRLSRKVIMPAEKLFLVLTESLVRVSEDLLPSISGVLAVFHKAAIPLHQPGSVVKNCKIFESVLLEDKKGASALMPRRSFFHFTSASGGTNSLYRASVFSSSSLL